MRYQRVTPLTRCKPQCGCRHFVAPSRVFAKIAKSKRPEGGWTMEAFLTNNGRQLSKDLLNVQRAAKAKGARMLTKPLTAVMRGQVEKVLELFERNLQRYAGVSAMRGAKALVTLEVGQHGELWAQAINDAFRILGKDVQATIQPVMQSVADDVLDKTTTLLTGGKPSVASKRVMQQSVNEIATQVTRINKTTQTSLARLISKAIDEGKSPGEVMEEVRQKIPQIATNRVPTIVRTEMGRVADRAAIRSMKDSAVVTHVSVEGCEAIEQGIPTFRGTPTCNIKNVPIEYAGDLQFHINHTGAITASGFRQQNGSTPALPLKGGEGIGTWEDRGRPVPAFVSDGGPPKPPQAPPQPPAAPITPTPLPPTPPLAPAAPMVPVTPKPLPKPKPVVAPKPTPAPIPAVVDPVPAIAPIVPDPVPVNPLVADVPAPPITPSGIHSPTRLVEWSANAQLHADEVLNNIPFTTPKPEFWKGVTDIDLGESPLITPNGMRKSAGVLVMEPDGRVWIVEPKDHFGGYQHTFPKGGATPGITLQQSAIKEAFEESGLEVELTDLLGDFHGTTSVTRYYLAKRKGGAPWLHGWESQAVKLAPKDSLDLLLNMQRDKEILAALRLKLAGRAPSAAPITVPDLPPEPVKPVVKPKPLAKPKPVVQAPVTFPSNVDAIELELVDLGSAGGSTGARIMQNRTTGQKFILKRGTKGAAADRIAEEMLADDLYSNAGARVPQGRLYLKEDGTAIKLTAFIEGDIQTLGQYLEKASSAQRAAILEDARKGFHLDAWLGNWDTVGMGKDNMLVAGGKVWRVDNGGALRWRAQGQRKGSFDSDGVMELWTMRNRSLEWGGSISINKDAHDIFRGIKPYQLADMIAEARDAGKIDDALAFFEQSIDEGWLPGNESDWRGLLQTLEGRAKALNDFAVRGERWRAALMDETFFDDTSYMMDGFRRAGFKSALSKELKPKSSVNWVEMVDENGKPWDHLRIDERTSSGQPIGERWLREFAALNGIAPDAACELVSSWTREQAGSSWRSSAVKYKAWVATRTLDQTRVSKDDFYWGKKPPASLERSYGSWMKKCGLSKEQGHEVLTAWHAFQQSVLENVDLPNVDKDKGILRVFRTEDDYVTSVYSLKTSNTPQNPDNKAYKRGACESTSIVWAKGVHGYQTYEHAVPICRVMGMYPVSRPSAGRRSGLFAGDSENEFTVNLLGIRAKYAGNVRLGSDVTKLRKYSSNFEDWGLQNPYE